MAKVRVESRPPVMGLGWLRLTRKIRTLCAVNIAKYGHKTMRQFVVPYYALQVTVTLAVRNRKPWWPRVLQQNLLCKQTCTSEQEHPGSQQCALCAQTHSRNQEPAPLGETDCAHLPRNSKGTDKHSPHRVSPFAEAFDCLVLQKMKQ